MASARTLDSRWIRRYRVFFLLGSIILGFQVFLAFKFFPIDAGEDERAQEHRDVSGRGKINIEVLNEIVNNAGGVSARRYKESYLVDDEDGPANSNPDNGGPLRKIKVPPDKLEEESLLQGLGKQGAAAAPVRGQPSLSAHRAQSSPNKTGTGSIIPLRLEELDFTPDCEIVGREAVSAIHRARTQNCKKLLADVACRSHAGTLYPTRLPHLCPAPGFESGRSLGCFQDEKTFRLLSGYYANLKATNSPAHCINLCLQSGFPYAGVQYSSECFCGSEEPPSPARLPDSSCNMKCPADPKLACGGFFTINVYQTGIAKFVPQVPREAPVPAPPHLPDELASQGMEKVGEEAPVRIAFLLTLNGRALRQVRRLLKALFHTRHFFFIHVDARQDYLFRELLPLERMTLLQHPWGNVSNISRTMGNPNPFSNVRLSRKRFSTIWGGASLLRTLLESMRQLLLSPWPWDYVVNLSESDFPVKTDAQLVSFLTANRGRSFVKSHGRDAQRFVQKQGLDKTFVECDLHMWRAGERQLPQGIAVDGGSDWVALARPFVAYVASGGDDPDSPISDSLVRGLKALFRHTLLPAESFFHTALRNSKHCGAYVDNNLHVTNWRRRLGCRCQYRHVVDWCGCSPNDFRMDDWPRLQGTEDRQLYFARKFEPIISQAIIDRVETWLYGPYPSGVVSIDSYWQSTFHHADLSPAVDDAIITVAHSGARLGTEAIFKSNSAGLKNNVAKHKCQLSPVKVLEVTSYHHDDSYQGSLVLYEAVFPGGTKVLLETWVVPQKHVFFYPRGTTEGKADSNQLVSKLKTLWVSSEFDQKEQVSRNHIGALGPFSEPALAYQLIGKTTRTGRSAQHHNVTFAWFDPAGQLAEVSQVSLEEGSLSNSGTSHSPSSSPPSSSYSSPSSSTALLAGMMGVVKPSLRQPIRPGVWRVMLVEDGALEPTAMVKFLISPLQFVSGVEVSQQQAGFLHNGPGQGYETFPAEFEKLSSWVPPGETETESGGARLRRALVNSRRFGHDLHGWIDSLLSKFYTVRESCLAESVRFSNVPTDEDAHCDAIKHLQPCASTKWSSLFPDPKSEIRSVNFTTGRLNRW